MKNYYPCTLTLYLLLFLLILPLMIAGFLAGLILLPVVGGFAGARKLFTNWHDHIECITRQRKSNNSNP